MKLRSPFGFVGIHGRINIETNEDSIQQMVLQGAMGVDLLILLKIKLIQQL